jgi:uncharacterized protein (DUF2141 family)
MKKLHLGMIFGLTGAMALPALLSAAVLGPAPAMCASGGEPSILVRASGFKSRTGTVRVRTFGGSPSTYFDKRKALKRVEYPMPASGAVEICMPVPAAGVYAVDVRHDINNNNDTDRSDGIGASGNPKISLFSILFGRKPDAKQVQVTVGKGTAIVPVVVRYL